MEITASSEKRLVWGQRLTDKSIRGPPKKEAKERAWAIMGDNYQNLKWRGVKLK